VRDILLADWLLAMSKKFRARYFFELHTLSRFSAQRYRRVLFRARGIITTNEQKKKDMARVYGLPAEKILVAPNGVDAEEFRALKHKKNEMRRELGLDANAAIVVYAGTDAEEYGTHILREAMEMVKTSIRILIISGKPRNEALKYMAAADVLVAPYMAANEHFEKYMSPMKIREYMAMERPMVTADLPSIRAMIPGDAAFFVPPGSAKSLASVLLEIFTSRKTDARKRAERAALLAGQFSWDARANAISAFIQKNI
jgi:glycosyltransferase involved in cell wall biosynthesis